MRVDSLPFISSCWGRSCCLTSRLRTSITVEIVSPGPSRATIEARPERAADRAPAHGRTSLPPRGPVGCCRRGTRRPRRLIGKCRAGAAAGNVSAEGEAIRSNDYRKDTTVKAPSTRPAAVLGLDVGKSSHWACLIDRDGEVLASAPVRNREAELDALFASAPAGTLVVDQFRNIGSLAVRRARAAGLGVAHLPGLAASRAAGLFAGEAKTDERDAAVIARTALGVPDSLSGVPGRGEALEAARALSSQRDHVVACATRDKNRLRAVLLESCPALEAAVDLSDRRWLELLAGFGGAWGIARSGAGGPRAEAAGEAAAASTAPPPALVEAENRQVRFLAARISEALDEAGALEAETAGLLEGDDVLRVPAHRARHRAEDGGAARGIGRHREVPGPRPPGLVLRHSPEGEELRHVGEVGQGVQAGRREAQVSSDLLVQQPGEVVGALRRVLPGLQGAGHGARAGAQGRREEAAQGDIRRDARPGALPGVASKVDKTIGTPNDYLSNLAVGDVPYVLALGETPCASGRGLLAGIARLLGVLQALWAKNAKYEYCCCCSAILLPQNNGHKVNMFINASTYKPDTELIEQCGGAYKLQERCFGSFWMLLKK